ncbi:MULTISPECIES: metal ABC transporter ATP-binding protein [Lactobacillaceae]|uniref:metal ABC transporter ATP-binding protein n=1 Tax=Lactobacillaceae TaxID=33958 RepID=UPI000C1B62DD|nr:MULTISPECIES: ATP-binding cassette domain-containing protein [Lactobacillaceae]
MIEVKNLSKKFGQQLVFENVNFSINEGEFVSLVGPNGSGKTTLIKMLMGLEKKTSGEIKINKSSEIGYVPQFRNIDLDYPLDIKNFVTLNQKFSFLKSQRDQNKAKLNNILNKTHLTDLQSRPLGLASGGEKQKAYLAQALINDPKILILDESTASMDVDVKYQLMDLVSELNKKENITVLFITHDYDLTKKYTNRALLFENHQINSVDVKSISEDMFE